MIQKLYRYGFLALLSSGCIWFSQAAPAKGHWDDLSTAEITLPAGQAQASAEVQIILTYPTELTAFADDDGSSQLSETEISRHSSQLKTFFQDHIQLKDSQQLTPTLSLAPRSGIPASSQTAPNSHTGLQLTYTWPTAVQLTELSYNLFVPDAPEATCLATISQAEEFTSYIFTPEKTTFALPSVEIPAVTPVKTPDSTAEEVQSQALPDSHRDSRRDNRAASQKWIFISIGVLLAMIATLHTITKRSKQARNRRS